MSLWDFAGPDYLEDADRAAALSMALLAVARVEEIAALTPGAGLIWHDDYLSPYVLANAKFSGQSAGKVTSILELGDDNPVRRLITQALGAPRPWFARIRIFSTTPPQAQVSPGGSITRPVSGTVGCQVTWNSGTGFTTAGHVAPTKGTDVHDSTRKIGTVVWANDPAGHGTSIEPDIAIVECAPGVSVSPKLQQSAKARPAGAVTITSSGNKGAIKAFSEFVVLDLGNQKTATVGDSYQTDREITSGGDSGGPAMVGNDLIGHVVGASTGVCSYIQAVDYQLKEAATRGGLTGLRL